MTSVALVSSVNQIRYVRQTVGYGIAVGAVGVRVATGAPEAVGRIGVYALDGRKLIDSGDLSFAESNTAVSAAVSHTLPAGEYYFTWASNQTGITMLGATSSSANEILTEHSADTYYMGNAASRWSGPGEPLPEMLSITADTPIGIPVIALLP